MVKINVIIPTCNRHELISEKILYFRSFSNCHIFICDSTLTAFNGQVPLNVSYVHMPGKAFVNKMSDILELISSEYVVVCADDDFVLEIAVNEINHCLVSEKYVMGIGQYYGFDLPFNGFYKAYKEISSINRKFPLCRIFSIMSNYYMSLWAVYRTDTVKAAYKILSDSHFSNNNFIEITIAIKCAIDGGIKVIKNIYGVRECDSINSSWRHKHINLLSALVKDPKKTINQIYSISKASGQFMFFIFGFCVYIFYLSKQRIFRSGFKKEFVKNGEIKLKGIEKQIKKRQ